MPTAIPNFLHAQSPLGAAFANLASTLASGPSEADRYQAADNALLTHRKVQGQQGLADFFRNNFPAQDAAPAGPPPAVAVPQMPDPGPMNDGGMPVGVPVAPTPNAASPISQAFAAGVPQATPPAAAPAPNFGDGIANAIFAGMDPKELGGYQLFGAANKYGATDQRTQNAQVGAGQTYENTYGALDRKETDMGVRNDADNATSVANNAATNAQSDANNRRTVAAQREIAQNKLNADEASGVGSLDPATVSYLAEQVRNGAPLPALGMGKQAAAMRSAILQEAAREDLAAGRSGTDAVVARQDYAGNLSGSRLLGNREASIGTAVHELDNIIPTVKAQLDAVTRTGLYPVDVILNAAQHGTNDPALAKLAVGINDAVNAHARAINPQGQVTVEGQKIGYSLLNQVHDAKYLGAALDQMAVGAQRALAAPGQTREDLHNTQRGTLGGKAAPAGNPAPAPAAEEHWVRGPDGKLQRAQ